MRGFISNTMRRTSVLRLTEPKGDLRCIARWRCPHHVVI